MMKSCHSVTHIQLLFVSGRRFFVLGFTPLLFCNVRGVTKGFVFFSGIKDKTAKRYQCTCQFPYSSFISDFQRDSDEEGVVEIGLRVELPFPTGSNFKEFSILHQNTESVEDVKQVLSSLEKDTLLLDLIPIAFDDLATSAQVNGLFTDKDNSINTIWDFIVISFRFFGVQTGLHKAIMTNLKDWISFFVEHSTLPVAEYETIIKILDIVSAKTKIFWEADKLNTKNQSTTPIVKIRMLL